MRDLATTQQPVQSDADKIVEALFKRLRDSSVNAKIAEHN
jgi:hypothetical protein